MNRGSLSRLRPRRVRRVVGFNEAPIHESGKYCQAPPRRRPRHRFNEAPIHESGKSNNTDAATAAANQLQ